MWGPTHRHPRALGLALEIDAQLTVAPFLPCLQVPVVLSQPD